MMRDAIKTEYIFLLSGFLFNSITFFCKKERIKGFHTTEKGKKEEQRKSAETFFYYRIIWFDNFDSLVKSFSVELMQSLHIFFPLSLSVCKHRRTVSGNFCFFAYRVD